MIDSDTQDSDTKNERQGLINLWTMPTPHPLAGSDGHTIKTLEH